MTGRRPDPSIPRHRAGANTTALRMGNFIRRGDVLILADVNSNNIWPEVRVQCVSGYGFVDDGVSVVVQPTVIDPNSGETLVQGDVVIFSFLNGNEKMPIVLGVVAPVGRTDDLPVKPTAGVNPSRKKLTALDRTEQGAVRGRVDVTVNDDGAGVLVEVSDANQVRATITATTDEVELTKGTLSVKLSGSNITANSGGTTYRLVDERALARLASMMGDIATGIATIPYTLPPTFFEDIAQLAGKADATTVLKAE